MRDRLVELFKKIEKEPAITCPAYKTDKTCKDCKYSINDSLCNHIERQVDYLLANGVVVPPCKVGDMVYCIVAKGGLCGGLIYTGHIVKRKVDKLIYDGSRWEMMSERVYPDWKKGNELLYAYFDDLVFVSEEKAEARLAEILGVGKGKEEAERALKGGE